MYEIELEEEPIELCNLLKLMGLADTGGQAKLFISEGYVHLNGELCTQKRKKIYAGDQFSFNEEEFVVSLAEGVVPAERTQSTPMPHTASHTAQAAPKQNKPAKTSRADKSRDKKTGRKPISFG
ncbi:RNA-binding S4 domain-containing protein [Pseudoalteromonas xiamenensis]|uniref:RNA-binding S4 domain-containing protein n=1 Tax=Pseudoalteromonas xiamenensis TaxID=882626 RepID=UPI0027E4E19F|nr:RNA-binding S4 domain-containing protein [Pseudoalteromonas xiamenensis]WMN61456.1 RNA-binding S4 domain-containing protein [Pseudoalteromonas xiamenensis]